MTLTIRLGLIVPGGCDGNPSELMGQTTSYWAKKIYFNSKTLVIQCLYALIPNKNLVFTHFEILVLSLQSNLNLN